MASANVPYPVCVADVDASVMFASSDTNRLVGSIAEYVARKSPWPDTVEGGTLSNGSTIVRSVVSEEAVPAGATTGTRPVFINSVDACGTIGGVDQVGSTEFQFQLKNFRGRGPKICVKTTRTAFAAAYPAAINSLKRLLLRISSADIRANALDNSGCKLTCDSTATFAQAFNGDINAIGTAWRNRVPDSPLSFKGLEFASTYLRETLGVEPFDTPINDDGVMKFIGSQEINQRFRDELNIGEDLRAMTMGRYQMGVDSIQGYTFSGPYHAIMLGTDPEPLRASAVVLGVPTLVEPKIAVTTTNGVGSRPNPAWVSAQFEIGFLMGRRSFARLVPEAYKIQGWDFSPQITNGGLQFVQLRDAECHVFGDYGQHLYEIERAFQPLMPHAVCPILYKRCASTLGLVPCA